MALDYFAGQLPTMDARTRSGIEAGVFNILFVLNSGAVKDLLNSGTNVTPAILDSGECIMGNMAVAEHGAGGSLVNAALKYATQRHVLRRHADAKTAETVIWIDEYQNHLTEFDPKFLAECRSHKGAMVVMTQSLHSFYSEIWVERRENTRPTRFSRTFGIKIAHALGDEKSAQYFASLIGKRVVVRYGGSEGARGELWEEMTGRSRFTSSFNEYLEYVVAGDFTNGLRTGGPPNNVADGFVIRNGVPFACGENYLRVAFSQE